MHRKTIGELLCVFGSLGIPVGLALILAGKRWDAGLYPYARYGDNPTDSVLYGAIILVAAIASLFLARKLLNPPKL